MLKISVNKFVGNKVKGQISKRVLQSAPNFPKNEHFLPPDTQKYLGAKNILSLENVLCFLVMPVLRSALLPYYRRITGDYKVNGMQMEC